MDLLGSILNSMDKPPSISDKQKTMIKKQRDEMLVKRKAEKEKMKKFREEIEKKVNVFLQNETETRLKFSPMDQVYRGIIFKVFNCKLFMLTTSKYGNVSFSIGIDSFYIQKLRSKLKRIQRGGHLPFESRTERMMSLLENEKHVLQEGRTSERSRRILSMARQKKDAETLERLYVPAYESTKGLSAYEREIITRKQTLLYTHGDEKVVPTKRLRTAIETAMKQEPSSARKPAKRKISVPPLLDLPCAQPQPSFPQSTLNKSEIAVDYDFGISHESLEPVDQQTSYSQPKTIGLEEEHTEEVECTSNESSETSSHQNIFNQVKLIDLPGPLTDIKLSTTREASKSPDQPITSSQQNTPNQPDCSAEEIYLDNKNPKTKRKRRNDRKNCCIFCLKLCTNFRRHLLRNHKDEMEVAEYIALMQHGGDNETEESKAKRYSIFDKLRNKGNYEHNKIFLKDVELNQKECVEFLPSRRPKVHVMKVENYVTCSLCNSTFSKRSFRKHVPKCGESYTLDDSDTDIEGDDTGNPNSEIRPRKCSNFAKTYGTVNVFMADSVSDGIKKYILPLLKIDDAVKAALKDQLIMAIISDFHSNHLQIKDKYVVTKKIHDGGKFLINVQKKDPSINTFLDCFDPFKSKVVLDTVREMCGTDSDTGNVSIVGMPPRLSWLLNEGASRALVDSICNNKLSAEEKDAIKKKICEFNEVKKLRWRYVASSNAELTRKKRKIEKPKIMPNDEDIITFSTYLNDQEITLYEQLKKKQSCLNYEKLCEVTIAHIITLSRRRPAEAANAELNNYVNRNKKETFSSKILSTLNDGQLEAMEKLEMFVVPGKNEHEVPVLLTKNMMKNIDLLVSLRARLSIPPSNKLLFARPGLETPFSGTKVMHKLVNLCPGLKNPSHLTPTGLRHHVASVSQVHGDTFVNHLAKFMGHTAHIHKKSYQLPSEVLQRAVVGKELLAMEGEAGPSQNFKNRNEPSEQVIHTLDNHSEIGKLDNILSTSRCLRRWTEQEKEIVINEFRHYIELKKNPGLPKCRELIKNFEILKDRTPAQINSMIDNINKGKLKWL